MSEPTKTAASLGAELDPGTNVGGYLIDAKIGEGGMGQVYGAHHPRIGKRVAIKVLSRAYCGDPTVVERFEQEARFVNEIKHPNIVDVFQFGELADKRSFFIMEWLEGEPLTALIDRGPVSAQETMEILDVVCDALQAAHEAKVIHRDLKSDNIFLVTKRGKRQVKLLDFGLAKLAGRGVDGQPVGTTKSGILVGTPAYMSPEQARSKPVDGRTDVYALGCLAYKMLTSQLPFPGDNAMDIILQQLNKPAPNPSKLAPKTPPQLAKLVVQMMAKDPEQRPSLTAIRELFAKLQSEPLSSSSNVARRSKPISTTFEDSRPVQDRPRKAKAEKRAPEPQAERPAPRKRGVGVLLAIMVVLAGVIGVAVVLLKKQQGSTPAPATTQDDVTLTVSAEPVVTGSAAAVQPAEQPMIEFEEDQVGKPTAGSAASAGSATHRHHHKKTGSSDEDNDVAEAPALPPPNKPGALIIVLEHTSTITIDGKVVAQASKGGRYEVSPGHHEIEVAATDRAAVKRSVDLDPGGTAFIKIIDDKSGAPEAPKPEATGSAQ